MRSDDEEFASDSKMAGVKENFHRSPGEKEAAAVGQPLKRILVADDDPLAREISRDMLEKVGFEVHLAADGVETVALAKQVVPDLILLDVMMPRLDGFGACRQLRANASTRRIPVIMVTGSDDVGAAEQAFDVKATDFVGKPINWSVLLQRIRYILRASTSFAELEKNRQRLLNAQRIAKLGYWDLNLDTGVFVYSDEVDKIVGHPLHKLDTLKKCISIVHEEDKAELVKKFPVLTTDPNNWTVEFRVVTADKSVRVIKITGESLVKEGRGSARHVMGTIQDISETRRNEAKIRHMAFFDDLTGLHNRSAFIQELERSLQLHKRMGSSLALIYLDIDDFKRVNDSHGHHVGDQFIGKFSERLSSICRESDLIARSKESRVLARFGGDEFILMLSGLQGKSNASAVAKRITESLSEAFLIAVETPGQGVVPHEVYASVSMGVSVFPDDGNSASELLKNADIAMYEAKKAGKNTYRFYAPEMNQKALRLLELETRLRTAVERQELVLNYQPQIRLSDGRFMGVEALLRWRNPDLGDISPAEFIPVAEKTGLIVSIGAWVMKTACAQVKSWQRQGLPPLKVAVNLSGVQFRRGDLVKLVAGVLAETCLSADLLELELTESVVMDDVETSINTFQELKELGVAISIDDFGTGYSSLSYLSRFPIDTLKVDQSFVQGVGVDANNTAITKAIIAMAHSLGFEVVAEGIEEVHQLTLLKAENCAFGQGWLFGKPLLGEHIPEFINDFSARDFFTV
ncbi:MAG TPA: hypothetical protein DCF62_06475 [Porticoccaceae bacterium]|nr:hypothetical protein [Porticoccaceae bacterium]